nr:hypothetical protein Itr_chr09CG06120 [Ipomoea trifida]
MAEAIRRENISRSINYKWLPAWGIYPERIDIHLVDTYILTYEERFSIHTDLILHNNPTQI